jgi:hypothetical protein
MMRVVGGGQRPGPGAGQISRGVYILLALLLIGFAPMAWAGEADVVAAKVTRASDDVYHFDVTIRSRDRGWDYYCDRFEVVAPAGTVLGVRELVHPHEIERPFTRDLYGVKVPSGTTHVVIRARHKPRGYDGATLRVELPR